MSSSDDHGADFDEAAGRREFRGPYTSHHPIPTVQKYRQEKGDREERQKATEETQHDEADESDIKRAYGAAKAILKGNDPPSKGQQHDPYPTANRNYEGVLEQAQQDQNKQDRDGKDQDNQQNGDHSQQQGQTSSNTAAKHGKPEQSATEAVAGKSDPREKRKAMKHGNRGDGGREVTDPVTHLPIVIHDSTTKDLQRAPENEPQSGTQPRTSTGLSGATKSDGQLDLEQDESQKSHAGMHKLFPPPSFEDAKAELTRTYQLAMTVGVGATIVLAVLALIIIQVFDLRLVRETDRKVGKWSSGKAGGRYWSVAPIMVTIALLAGLGSVLVINIRGWLGKRVEEVWEDEVWDAARQQEIQTHEVKAILPESVAWMNSLLASVWPLINPDLFASIQDMLEDVMQASLPKVVRMVSVDDLGQGSEAVRILGIRWLPTGAASQSVDAEGRLQSPEKQNNDRAAAGEGHIEGGDSNGDKDEDKNLSDKQKTQKKQKEQEQEAVREGMEAEQGDFVNLELAFAYRARSAGKSFKAKVKNAHLYLKFYLPGGIAVPIWVEMKGLIGTMRLRLQLTPDPPFFSLCTITFMGQPHADLSCIPLSRHALNVMDIPLISSFVQSSIDAALAEYVAPKSLTLDLKDMLVGDDFKKDTTTRGVVMIFIKQARGFKEGDGGFGPFKGASDSYVTVSWGKFGKPVASTRIIVDDQEPNWHEWATILVTSEELNAKEKLRIQLWDSDKYTADDDLGRVEVDLHELMHSPETKNKMCDREDRFVGQDADEKMPGTITWSVGYFSKTRITDEELQQQTEDENIRSKEALKQAVSHTAERKLREATVHDESKEIRQQKMQDYKEREDAMIISAPPPSDYPSGIFSIQIHNITGLEVESLQKQDKNDGTTGDREDEAEQSDDLPSSYCTIILNHQKIYRTRTKPKNAKPFFNAGTERFVRDWRDTEVIISVRDDREGEADALLGIVYLPLKHLFEERSQIVRSYPLVGGVGYGRCRVSMVWRSIELQMPHELMGWDYGTVEIKSARIRHGGHDLKGHRLKIRSNIMHGKMSWGDDQGGMWTEKHGKEAVFLAVRKRYCSALILEWRKSTFGPDSTLAFAVLWLKDVPDEENRNVTLKVWKGDKKAMKRATSNCDYDGDSAGSGGQDKTEQDPCLGEIELEMRFWHGLSGYHKRWARKGKNKDVQNVMEVLDTAGDENLMDDDDGDDDSDGSDDSESGADSDEDSQQHRTGDRNVKKIRKKLKNHTNQDSSEPSEDDGNGAEADKTSMLKNPVKSMKEKVADVVDGHNDVDDGSRGVRAQIRDYKDHHRQLHRKHRGIMQWKGMRTMDWAAGKVKRAGGRVSEVFEHSEKETGVETEV